MVPFQGTCVHFCGGNKYHRSQQKLQENSMASNGGRSAVSSWGSMSRSNLAVMSVLLVSAMNLQGAKKRQESRGVKKR